MASAAVAAAERAALIDLFEEVGPDAPTLCGDWTTADLAAHLVVRDQQLLGAAGIVLPGPFEALTEKRMDAVRRRGWRRSIDAIRRGPAVWWRLAPASTNVNEFFVHHEDVRRAGDEADPRPADEARDDALWELIAKTGRLMARRSPVGLVARTPDGRTKTLRHDDRSVTMVGPPGEIVLFLNGRKNVAKVELQGDEGAIAELRVASFGI